ncbi:hypothetical protein LCGC14_1963060, partial [marine sediment metagenome]
MRLSRLLLLLLLNCQVNMTAPPKKKFREIWTGKDGVKHMRVNYHEG